LCIDLKTFVFIPFNLITYFTKLQNLPSNFYEVNKIEYFIYYYKLFTYNINVLLQVNTNSRANEKVISDFQKSLGKMASKTNHSILNFFLI